MFRKERLNCFISNSKTTYVTQATGKQWLSWQQVAHSVTHSNKGTTVHMAQTPCTLRPLRRRRHKVTYVSCLAQSRTSNILSSPSTARSTATEGIFACPNSCCCRCTDGRTDSSTTLSVPTHCSKATLHSAADISVFHLTLTSKTSCGCRPNEFLCKFVGLSW